ncbi:MAG TPA: ABC transporter permease [Isosphaeraceae bacterium]|jgi:ABC-2 type transport system permease protein|nr:ABC transporter permease [Isosphaeraceae bacterium]
MTLGPASRRLAALARKELLHIVRDPTTLFFAVFLPVLELFLLGYAIDTNVRHVRTVVFDAARTQESRTLLRRFTNSEDFRVVGEVFSDRDLAAALVSGRARVGIKVPEDYSRRVQAGRTGQVLILVDGSESSVAAEAVNVGNAIALEESLGRLLQGRAMPVEARPRVLFNPDTRSPNFFIPGLMVVLSQMMAIMLSANTVVREKEKGTLEQLFMTPIRPAELVLGKMAPYLGLVLGEFCVIGLLMATAFRVPVHGSFATLVAISLPFFLAMIGWGLAISTRAATRDASMQMSTATVLPSVFLSGYVFPLDSMPVGFRYLAGAMPTTWMIDAARGVILRGAGWAELWPNVAVLWMMAAVSLAAGAALFKKRLG